MQGGFRYTAPGLEALAELFDDWGRPDQAEAVLRRMDRN